MKAKDLAALLLENPEAEVVHYMYTGGDTPLIEIRKVIFEPKGTKTECHDGGDFIDKNGLTTTDIVIVVHDWND